MPGTSWSRRRAKWASRSKYTPSSGPTADVRSASRARIHRVTDSAASAAPMTRRPPGLAAHYTPGTRADAAPGERQKKGPALSGFERLGSVEGVTADETRSVQLGP